MTPASIRRFAGSYRHNTHARRATRIAGELLVGAGCLIWGGESVAVYCYGDTGSGLLMIAAMFYAGVAAWPGRRPHRHTRTPAGTASGVRPAGATR